MIGGADLEAVFFYFFVVVAVVEDDVVGFVGGCLDDGQFGAADLLEEGLEDVGGSAFFFCVVGGDDS